MRRREFISLFGAAVVLPFAARPLHADKLERNEGLQEGIMAPRTIVAVAIGDSRFEQVIKNADDDLSNVRPYISGLIKGLSTFQVGRDYEIIYRERQQGDLDGAFRVNAAPSNQLIFCMSTTVTKAAQAFTDSIPIVGIVSNPGRENVTAGRNICGVSARRSQTAGDCCERFLKTVTSLREIRVLHKANYNPSVEALAQVKAAAAPHGVMVTEVAVASAADIADKLGNMPARDPATEPATVGIQVLPADVCFGAAQSIIKIAQAQKRLPTFFPVTDWVRHDPPSALGGYGVPQERSGQLLAEQVALIWQTGNIPAHRFKDASDSEFKWLASRAAARTLNINLPSDVPTV